MNRSHFSQTLTPNASLRGRRERRSRAVVRVERLEDRTTPADPGLVGPGVFYDPATLDLCIVGTDQSDHFTLAADDNDEVLVTLNGKALQAIDVQTNQPRSVTLFDIDSILGLLRAGDDAFEFESGGFELIDAEIDLAEGNDSMFVPLGQPLRTSPPIQMEEPRPVTLKGGPGDDLFVVAAAAGVTSPEDLPRPIRLDGGEGTADAFRLIGTGAAERMHVVSMNDVHDIALAGVGGVLPMFQAQAFGTERLFANLAGGEDKVSARIEASGLTAPGDFHFELGDGADLLELVGLTSPR